jgi:ribosome-binding protein aMBF1 (putative translation factor)
VNIFVQTESDKRESIASFYQAGVKAIQQGVKPIDPQKLAQQVGRRVAELRSEIGLTQAELAEHMEVSVRYLQSIEAGAENLTLETIAKLASVLGAKPIAFFEPPATKKPRPGRPKRSA